MRWVDVYIYMYIHIYRGRDHDGSLEPLAFNSADWVVDLDVTEVPLVAYPS